MSPEKPRPAYDRWRDAVGIHLPDGRRVEQVDVDRAHGALRSRHCKQGDVVGRSRSGRLYVCFDGEDKPVSIRPHLLRMRTEQAETQSSVEHIADQLEQFGDVLPIPAGSGQ